MTTDNAKLLLMRPHPQARIIHRCVGDTTCTSQHHSAATSPTAPAASSP
jgi:hypothetical protein